MQTIFYYTVKYNRENDLYKFSKRNVHFLHFFAVRLPAWNIN
jgi:hypothetical protein